MGDTLTESDNLETTTKPGGVVRSTLLKLITTSRLKVWQACAMKHDLRYRKRIEPVQGDEGPTRFGGLWHHGQEFYWSAMERLGSPREHCGASCREGTCDHYPPRDPPIQKGLRAIAESPDVDPFELAKCTALLCHYQSYYQEETRDWRIVAVEVEFRIPLVNPKTGRPSRTYDLGGKIDLIIEIMTGPHAGFYVVEHKTSSEDIRDGSLYWRKLRLDDQITIYVDGARSLGFPVRGVIYDVVQRPGLMPAKATPEEDREYTQPKDARPGKPCKAHKAEALGLAKGAGVKLLVRDIPIFIGCEDCTLPKPAEPSRLYKGQRSEDETPEEFEDRVAKAIMSDPDRYYRRPDVPIVRLEDEMVRMRQNIWNHCQRLIADKRDDWHPLSTSSCGDFHRLCDYFDLCTGDADVNDRTRFQIREHAHPELSAEIQTTETDKQ